MSDQRGGRRRRGRSTEARDGATGLAEQEVEVVEVEVEVEVDAADADADADAARDRRADAAGDDRRADAAGDEREGAVDERPDEADAAPVAATTAQDAAGDVPPAQQGGFASRRSGWPAVPAWLQTLLVFVTTAVVVFLAITALGAALG